MPGLIRGVARTAVIAGTATHVSNNVSRRQAGRWAEKDQQQYQEAQPEPQYVQAAPVAQAPPVDLVGELTKLSALKDAGALSEAEYEVAKAKLLNG